MKAMKIFLLYLLMFTAIFIVSLYEYHQNSAIIEIGLSSNVTNAVLMAFSVLGILKTFYHIVAY